MAGRPGRRGWGYLRRLPSGRWQASYIEPLSGKRYTASTTYTVKKDAEGWLSNEHRLIERDEWTPPQQRRDQQRRQMITLKEFADKWLRERDLKDSTRHEYERTLATRLTPLHDLPLKALDAATVRSWYATLDKSKPTARKHAYTLLSAICTTATADKLLPENPCRIKGATTVARKVVPVALTADQLHLLVDSITPRYRALVLLGGWLGLRWGELIELRGKDIAADGAIITIPRSVQHRGGCHISTPKTKKVRQVHVPPHMRQELIEAIPDKPDDLLFASDDRASKCGHPNETSWRRNHWNPALAKSGLHLRIHDLRHTSAVLASQVGNLTEVMDRLGQTTIAAAQKYQQVASGRAEAVAVGMSGLMRA